MLTSCTFHPAPRRRWTPSGRSRCTGEATACWCANAAQRYSVGDRLPGLVTGAGGRLTIRIQADDPGPGHNWLPAPSGEGFYVVLRLYQPRRRHLEFQFPYPPLRRL
ncbi:DUF1214 domain-containing protein [Hydrogenophaga sp. UC242_50]|uniref:DUF1214 domain-containing protein n=1 Tax=Hydrogenophaga sp. UC242_50 TaxID=3350169 RepID=UPI0036D3A36B